MSKDHNWTQTWRETELKFTFALRSPGSSQRFGCSASCSRLAVWEHISWVYLKFLHFVTTNITITTTITIIIITGIILILIIINLIFPAELGDHSPLVHTAAVVSEFRFVPVQTEIMEAWHLTFCFNDWIIRIFTFMSTKQVTVTVLISCRQVEILECYRQQQGKSPAEAEGEYLAVARCGWRL